MNNTAEQNTDKNAMTQKAVRQIMALAQGNSGKKNEIKPVKQSYEHIYCQAITHLELTHKTDSKTAKGRLKLMQVIEDPATIPALIEKEKAEAIKNNEIRRFLTDMFLGRPDKGFALHGQEFDLPALRKELGYYEPCKSCTAQGKQTCQTCRGSRRISCTQCHGRTVVPCTFCHSTGFVNGQGGKQKPCTKCFGKKQVGCPLCQRTGSMSCRSCKGIGDITCSHCQGAGTFTTSVFIHYKVKTLFEIDRAALPVTVINAIETKGTNLAAAGEVHLKAEAVKREDGGLALQYNFDFPYQDLTVALNGKLVKASLFGYKHRLLKVSHFIDQMIEHPCALLQRAADEDGNIRDHIAKASKARFIAQTLLFTLTNPPQKAMIALKKAYPIGASSNLIKETVLHAGQAMANVSRKSYWSGFGLGGLVVSALVAGYFLSSLPTTLATIVPNPYLALGLEMLLIPVGGTLIAQTATILARKPLKQALGSLITPEQWKTIKNRSLQPAWMSYVAAAGIVVCCKILLSSLPF